MRPEIRKFRSDEDTRRVFLEDFIKVFKQTGSLELSSNYKKVLQIEKANEILGDLGKNKLADERNHVCAG